MATVAEQTSQATRLHLQGRIQEAVRIYEQILRVDPDNLAIRYQLGIALQGLGDLAGAAAAYEYVLRVQPDHIEALCQLGMVYASLGRVDDAITLFQQALRIRPNHAAAHNNLGVLLTIRGDLTRAAQCYQQAIQHQPDYAEAHNNLGLIYHRQGQIPEALSCFRRALELKPDYAEAHNNLGNTLRDQGHFEQALCCYDQALSLKSNYAEALTNRGVALANLDRLEEAVASHERALQFQPRLAQACKNLGATRTMQGLPEQALICFDQALQLCGDDVDTHTNRALTLLGLDRWEEGWREWEWRWRKPGVFSRFGDWPLWDGARLEGRPILLHNVQGLGDMIHFIRYAPLVQDRGGRVIVECPPQLLRILRTCPGVDACILQGDPVSQNCVHCPVSRLPYLFGTTPVAIPCAIPYLFADSALQEDWRKRLRYLNGNKKVGIVWQGNPNYQLDRYRSCPLSQIARLTAHRGIQFISLQHGRATTELRQLEAGQPIIELGSQLGDFAEVAAAMMNLDLLITVDTAFVHLAGALGVTAWLLLAHASDWRWLWQRTDSLWYPTVRLFRQRQLRDWDTVLVEVSKALDVHYA